MIIASLQSENAMLKKKSEKLKKTNNKVMVCLAEYQVKMWHYEEKLNLMRSVEEEVEREPEIQRETEDTFHDEENIDNLISKNFTAEDTIELDAMEILKRSDRTFIGKILQILYRENMPAIQKRTLNRNTGENKVITPLKMKIITAMMIKRVNKVSDFTEKAERASQIYINTITSKSLYYLKQTFRK